MNDDNQKIVVPKIQHDVDEVGEGLVSPADIESTSKSCLVVIVGLLLIALVLCAVFAIQPFVK